MWLPSNLAQTLPPMHPHQQYFIPLLPYVLALWTLGNGLVFELLAPGPMAFYHSKPPSFYSGQIHTLLSADLMIQALHLKGVWKVFVSFPPVSSVIMKLVVVVHGRWRCGCG